MEEITFFWGGGQLQCRIEYIHRLPQCSLLPVPQDQIFYSVDFHKLFHTPGSIL